MKKFKNKVMSLSVALGMIAIGLGFSGTTNAQQEMGGPMVTCDGNKGRCTITLPDGTTAESAGDATVIFERELSLSLN